MIDFDSLIDLKEYIKDTMQEVLENEIYEEVVKLEQEVIEDVVYGWGIPVKYVRRGYDGGIIDDSNIVIDEIRVAENGVGIDIVNNTPIKGSDWIRLDELIEYGVDNSLDAPPYMWPRPFTATTQEFVEHGDIIEKALAKKFSLKEK